MKKYIIAAAALAVFTILGLVCHQASANKVIKPAADTTEKNMNKPETIAGTISAIDAVKSEIAVQDGKGGERVFGVEKAKLATLKIGNSVIAKVAENKAKNIKVIKRHGPMRP